MPASLVSVNVGLPRDVEWKNRTVHTGVWKSPVDGPQMVRRLNIDGDGQGDLDGHGGENRAVLVYQLHAYRHWTQRLQRDDLEPGSFGENFTVDGMPDDEVLIGDRFQIGEAVFEVTQPRVTCYRIGLRLQEPRMAALMVADGLPGFYFRVLAEGRVRAGDDIVKIASGPELVTVADIDALLYLPGHSRPGLQRALRIPALSPGWKTSLQALADEADKPDERRGSGNVGLTGAIPVPPPAWVGFRSMTVIDVHYETAQVKSVLLAAEDGTEVPNWLAGQSITVRIFPAGDGAALVRSYSLSNEPGATCLRISVKQEPHGAASGYIHAAVRTGDRLDVAAPRGNFVLPEGEAAVILVSAGVGVTPVLAMLHWLVNHDRMREVWWLHGARDGSEHVFAAESRALLSQLPHSQCHVFYSRPGTDDVAGRDYTHEGRMSAGSLGAMSLPDNAEAYVCGPTSFMAELSAGLLEQGLAQSRIHVEAFGAGAALNPGVVTAARPPHPPAGAPGTGPRVSFARSGLAAAFDGRYASLLELAEACDVPTRWSCRTGVCHNCETALVSGTVRYDPDPLEPPSAGAVLICCAQPTEATVLDL